MLTTANLEVILFSLPIYQLLYFTIQLISFKKTNPARKYLGLLLLGMTSFLLVNALYYSANETLMEWMYFIFVSLLLTLPPLFFLYILSLLNKKRLISRFSRFVLFIPPLLIFILNLVTYGLTSSHEKQLFLNTDLTLLNNPISATDFGLLVFWAGTGLILIVQLVFAAFKTVKLLKLEKVATLEQPSHLAHIHFSWINILSFSLLLFVVTAAIQLLFISNHTLSTAVVFNLIFLFSSGLSGYYGMKQDDLFNQVFRMGIAAVPATTPVQNNHQTVNTVNRKVVASQEAGEIIRTIEMHLNQNKLYLDKRFTINDLSRQTGINRNKLTFVINEVMEKNFYSLVNDYRVREAVDLMRDNVKNYTVETVAEMSGFQSRSSFYGCFKKFTGQTPREFMASVKQNDQPGENKLA